MTWRRNRRWKHRQDGAGTSPPHRLLWTACHQPAWGSGGVSEEGMGQDGGSGVWVCVWRGRVQGGSGNRSCLPRQLSFTDHFLSFTASELLGSFTRLLVTRAAFLGSARLKSWNQFSPEPTPPAPFFFHLLLHPSLPRPSSLSRQRTDRRVAMFTHKACL